MCACRMKIMDSLHLKFMIIASVMAILFCVNIALAKNVESNLKVSNSSSEDATSARALLSKSDEYVRQNQKTCLESHSFVSCLKYKASKIVWKLATNSFGFFPNEFSRELRDDNQRLRLIQTAEPVDILMFKDVESRSLTGDSELFRFIQFIKRAAETFGRNHAIQLSLSSDSGARITSGEVEEPRLKKKKKWLVILPLIILMKIAHLKMTVVSLLFTVLGANALIIGGVGWLIHYLKYKTLCKIHPHLVQSHSHVYDSDPAEYSQFVGSSFTGTNYNGAGLSAHDLSVGGYGKDWAANSKAYGGYNYLDTISKRIQ